LLGEFTRARIGDEPMARKLLGSSDADPGVRVKTLKEVGDTSLYVSGFFAESLERKLVDADYYIGMGEAAYAELARRMTQSSIRAVYEELSAKFPRFVDVLVEVKYQVDCGGTDVTQLYEQWLRSRSDWIERRLRRLGVLMPGSGSDGGEGYLQ
jgi:hypothetical protein